MKTARIVDSAELEIALEHINAPRLVVYRRPDFDNCIDQYLVLVGDCEFAFNVSVLDKPEATRERITKAARIVVNDYYKLRQQPKPATVYVPGVGEIATD